MQENLTGESSRAFSPFWPMIIVIVAVLMSLAWQWTLVRNQCAQSKDQISRLEVSAVPAQQMIASLHLFMKDVTAVGSQDPEVGAILDKYQVRSQIPSMAASAKSPAPPKAK
jgi:hypothetical protein